MTPAELRLLWQDESSLRRLTASAPPVTVNINERTLPNGRVLYEYDLEGEPPDRIGQSLSGEMIALIAGIRADFTSYGPRHPIRRALAEWERSCRRRHQAWYDHEHGMCGAMLRAVVEGGASVLWCSERYAISWPRAERLIAAGVNYVSIRYQKWEDDKWRLTSGVDSLQLNPAP